MLVVNPAPMVRIHPETFCFKGKKMSKYRVERTNCNCHPETCNHWDYTLEENVNGAWSRIQGSDSYNELVEIKSSLDRIEDSLISTKEPEVEIKTKYGDIVTYNDTQEIRDAVFERVMKYFIEHEAFFGESIHQSDDPIIDAPNVMSDIADDIIKFKFSSEE